MNITDELREFMRVHHVLVGGLKELNDIADRIDAEHHKFEDKMWLKGYSECLAQLMEGNEVIAADLEKAGWVKLPVDADEKPIHLGDEVYQVEGGWVYTVKSITFYPDNTTVSFGCKHGFGCDNAHNVRHYHAPTVENLLREFAQRWDEPMRYDRDEMLERYAAKLKLADDGEEQ